MTSALTYETSAARTEELHRAAARRRYSRTGRRSIRRVQSAESVAIRHATVADRETLARLAALDSAVVPSGDVLIASVAGEDQAAIAVATAKAIADPFRPTAQVVELLRVRAAALRRAEHPSAQGLRSRLALRTA